MAHVVMMDYKRATEPSKKKTKEIRGQSGQNGVDVCVVSRSKQE